MNCPQCGGLTVNEVSPGYYSCSSPIQFLAGVQQMPFGQQPIYQTRICGNTWQEYSPVLGSAPPVCICGTYAVGTCGDCGKPFCGQHSGLYQGHRYCNTYINAEKSKVAVEQARRQAESEQRAADQLKEAQDERKSLWAALKARGFPTQQTLYVRRSQHYRNVLLQHKYKSIWESSGQAVVPVGDLHWELKHYKDASGPVGLHLTGLDISTQARVPIEKHYEGYWVKTQHNDESGIYSSVTPIALGSFHTHLVAENDARVLAALRATAALPTGHTELPTVYPFVQAKITR